MARKQPKTSTAEKLKSAAKKKEKKVNQTNWQRFERAAARIYQELEPFAKVVHNEKILGRNSGIMRQIDVSIRTTTANCNLLIIVQAKDYKRRVDVNHVGTLQSVMEDVGASKGIIVCNAGFTEGAKNLAKNLGIISLCTIYDVEQKHWKSELTIPIFASTISVELDFKSQIDVTQPGTGTQKFLEWKFWRDQTEVRPFAEFTERWERNELDGTLDKWHELPYPCENLRGIMGEGSNCFFIVKELMLRYFVRKHWVMRHCTPDEYRGVNNITDEQVKISALKVSFPLHPNDDGWQPVAPEAVQQVEPGRLFGVLETTFKVLDLNKTTSQKFGIAYLGPTKPTLIIPERPQLTKGTGYW